MGQQELFQAGWVVANGSLGRTEFYPRDVVENVIPKKQPALAPLVKEIVDFKGAQALVLDSAHEEPCQALVKNYLAGQAAKAAYAKLQNVPAYDPAWKNWRDQLHDLSGSQLL